MRLFFIVSVLIFEDKLLFNSAKLLFIVVIINDTTNAALADTNNNLSGKAPVNHTHAWSAITGKPSAYTPSSHTHDDRYYTESETNSLLSGYVPKNGGGIITGTLQVSAGIKANGTYVVQGSTASQIRLNWTGSLMQVFVDNTLIGSIMFK